MASVATKNAPAQAATSAPAGPDDGVTGIQPTMSPTVDRDKVLPLPTWLLRVYFIFPVVLYIPDIIFNYYVYSDGWETVDANPVLAAGKTILVAFLSVGVVGMAYLLSVLAPWHWGRGHHIQAFFCAVGVIVATAITTWNSLAFRSETFKAFKTDEWVFSVWPQLKDSNISVTMILVSLAPPFWGLFWALVQPTETGRSLQELQESHAERLMRMQQDAELKRLKAETNAKIREAQLRGMAQTAATARQQAAGLLAQGRKKDGAENAGEQTGEQQALDAGQADAKAAGDETPPNVVPLQYAPTTWPRESVSSNRSPAFMNSMAAPTSPSVHVEPSGPSRPLASQSALFGEADVQGHSGLPSSDALPPRRPPTFAHDLIAADAMGDAGLSTPSRRAYEPGALLRGMNELPPVYSQTIAQTFDELRSEGRKVTQAQWAARVAQKLNIDESRAKVAIARYREAQRGK